MSYHTLGFDHEFELGVYTIDHVPGLVGFNLEFLNSDHHVSRMRVGDFAYSEEGRGEQSYLIGFSDRDNQWGIDQTRIRCTYYDLGVHGFETTDALIVTGTGRDNGRLFIPIPDLSQNETVFLRGFSFSATQNTNHHIRALGVRFDKDNRRFIVDFRDDSPNDDAFSARVLYFKVPEAPPGYNGNDLVFHASLNISSRFRKTNDIPKRAVQGITLLTGFYFEFEDSDHHIEKISINLQDLHRIQLAFHDNGDPPVYAEVQYTEYSSYDPRA